MVLDGGGGEMRDVHLGRSRLSQGLEGWDWSEKINLKINCGRHCKEQLIKAYCVVMTSESRQ